jgi:uncharacterized membrane protein YkoI
MKTKMNIGGMWLAVLLVVSATGCASEQQEQARLQAQAKISKEQAQAIARARVPDGTIKESDLEKEKGRLIWSFDMAKAGTKDITEVAVDALSGEVVSVDVETPEQQADEKD